jgi:TorA maturation chaperone TorD
VDTGVAGELADAWEALTKASATVDAAEARSEYDELFVGVGKCEINLHASHWLTGFMMEKPLVEVRAKLADLGLGRQERATLVEDHLAALCETMRILVSGAADRPPAALSDQRDFFEKHIGSWVFSCCTAIINSPVANNYRNVAQFTHCYFALEREALAME